MTPPKLITCSQSIRHNPLIPAALFFLAGIAMGLHLQMPVQFPLLAAIALLLTWIIAELVLTQARRAVVAQLSLAFAILFAGIGLAQLNQRYVPSAHIARFTAVGDQLPLTARLQILTPAEGNSAHGNLYGLAAVTAVCTDRGWIPSAGDIRLKWRASPLSPELRRGDRVEIYGWLKRPDSALNPGAMDPQKLLAADRIFAEIRVPRPTGLTLIDPSNSSPGPNLLTKARLFLRAKLLEHTTRIDVEAGYSMAALLLGHRDPIIQDVNQAFADAGVAHLMAISGSHIIFFTAMIYGVLCFIPMRPRRRELLVAAIVLAYVLATPCGPPVLRAAVALIMVLVARLIARPKMILNTLAAAAIIVALFRPTDILDAGAQLSFICTAGLVILAPRLYALLAGRWLAREEFIAALNPTFWPRFRVRLYKTFCGLLTANLLGAGIAIPLVAYHFGRINVYAVLTGLLALPVVGATMAASAVQLFLELISTKLAAYFAPTSTAIAHAMLWTVSHLAALPNTAPALRAPPAWLAFLLYMPLVLWAIRRWIHLSRAMLINTALAILTLTAAWYAATQSAGTLTIDVLSAGQGSCVLLHTPDGQLLLINAGSRDAPDLTNKAIAPALRIAGADRLDAMILTSITTVAAQAAAPTIERFHPNILFTSANGWKNRSFTYAGNSVERALETTHAKQISLTANSALQLGHGATLTILSPPSNADEKFPTPLILLCEYRHHRILLLEPATTAPLGLLQINNIDTSAEAIILLGPERGIGDTALKKLLENTHAKTIIWSGKTPWAPHQSALNEPNTANGHIQLTITNTGILTQTP